MTRIATIGCYTNLTNEEYHDDKNYISRSAIMDFNKSAFTFWAKHLNPNRPKKDATPQMEMGSAFHTLMLEPHLFNSQYVIEPERVLLKDVGREAYEEYKKVCEVLESSGKTVLTRANWLILAAMESKMRSNIDAMKLLENARIENSFFWQDEHSELLLKARPDILHENMIIDLKTSSDASPRAFQYEMMDYGYHVQFAMIRDAIEAIEGRVINNFINIVIETKYPHNMAIYLVKEAAVNEGQIKYKQICLDLKEALATNNFIDYGVQEIGLPQWTK